MDVIEAEDLGMPGGKVVLGWRNSMEVVFWVYFFTDWDPMAHGIDTSPSNHHQFGRICFGTFSRHIMQIQDSMVKSKGLIPGLDPVGSVPFVSHFRPFGRGTTLQVGPPHCHVSGPKK